MWRICVLIVVAVAAIVRPSPAQDVVGQAGPFAMPISNRSVERLGAALKLDADQKALARSLYAGYRSSFRQAADAGDAEMRAGGEKMREEGAQADYAKMAKDRIRVTKEFVAKAEKLEKMFLEDLKAILTPEQGANFERAERTRRREVGLKFSFIAGEGIDIFQILNDLKVDRDSNPALKEELDAYEVEIDRGMTSKQKMLRSVFDQIEKFEGNDPDPKLIEKTLKEFFETGVRLRDLHRQQARKTVDKLPADKQPDFDRAVKKASFPRVYADSAVDKVIAAARNLGDLSPEQKTELASIAETYGRESDGANGRWASAIEDKQSKLADNIMGMMGGPPEEAADDPLKMAREARMALDERTVARVKQILTPEQREKMPGIEKDKEWHGNEYMPDFDEYDAWEEWKKEDEPPGAAQPGPKRER